MKELFACLGLALLVKAVTVVVDTATKPVQVNDADWQQFVDQHWNELGPCPRS